MQESSTEVTRAARALLFFCKNTDPSEQWERAVLFMRDMNHMEKASVWKSLAEPGIDSVQLSVRRTAYKRALREAESWGEVPVLGHMSGSGTAVSLDVGDTGGGKVDVELLKEALRRFSTAESPVNGYDPRGASWGSPIDAGAFDGLTEKIEALVNGKWGLLEGSINQKHQVLLGEVQSMKVSCVSKQELDEFSAKIHSEIEKHEKETRQIFAEDRKSVV